MTTRKSSTDFKPWMIIVVAVASWLLILSPATADDSTEWPLGLQGRAVQGGMMIGRVAPGSEISLDDAPVPVASDGAFVIGFGRDADEHASLRVTGPDGDQETHRLIIARRDYAIERVDGLPQNTVTPPQSVLDRIRREGALVADARSRRDQRDDFAREFQWPAQGRISGVYGSQRVLNGTPGRPHYGVDVAAPVGTPVIAPAGGVITLAEPDLYYSGGTVILDHGMGVSSSFLHLSAVSVKPGQTVRQGDKIGEIGATGRATGPHLDWRMNVLGARTDPQLLVPEMPAEAVQ